MSDFQPIADRVEIEALRAEYSDAAMMGDYDRLASLFTRDAVLRWPHASLEFAGREAIRAVYHERYQRTGDGWKFTERAYQVRYLDTTPLTGSAPKAAEGTAPQTWPCALPPEEDEHGLDAAVDVFFLGQA